MRGIRGARFAFSCEELKYGTTPFGLDGIPEIPPTTFHAQLDMSHVKNPAFNSTTPPVMMPVRYISSFDPGQETDSLLAHGRYSSSYSRCRSMSRPL